MFYKVIKDNVAVDVLGETELQRVKMSEVSGMPIACGVDDNWFGILSSDSSVIYALDETEGYDHVKLVGFSSTDEYDRLKAEIDEQKLRAGDNDSDDTEVDISVLNDYIAQRQINELSTLIASIVDDLPDDDIVKYTSLVESWKEGKSYSSGKRLSYNNHIYKVIKDIKTSGATPDNSAAYYQALN